MKSRDANGQPYSPITAYVVGTGNGGIVNSIDGYDEISLTSDFKVITNDYERIFKPSDLGFETAKPEEIVGGATEEEAKQIFDNVLTNTALPAQK